MQHILYIGAIGLVLYLGLALIAWSCKEFRGGLSIAVAIGVGLITITISVGYDQLPNERGGIADFVLLCMVVLGLVLSLAAHYLASLASYLELSCIERRSMRQIETGSAITSLVLLVSILVYVITL